MIDTHLYWLEAELETSKVDKNGRTVMKWTNIFAQVKKDNFEFSESKERAFGGDFDDTISHWKLIYLKGNQDGIVKLVQENTKGKEQSKVLMIKENENFSKDFHHITNLIRELNMTAKSIGRPIMMNTHTGRGVSALSRNAKDQSYRGLVNILVICLLMSNLHNILNTINGKGYQLGGSLYDIVFDPKISGYNKLWLPICLQFWVSSPLISFLIEKYIASNKNVPRAIVFGLIALNMVYILGYPVYFCSIYDITLLIKSLYLVWAACWFMKFLSYHHIWHDIRYHRDLIEEQVSKGKAKPENKTKSSQKQKTDEKEDSDSDDYISEVLSLPTPILKSIKEYPQNVNLKDCYVFWLIPTMVFQIKYPFNKEISISGFICKLIIYLVLIMLYIVIVMDYITPLVMECAMSIRNEEYYNAAYFFARLTVPNTYSWLIMFFGNFHIWPNALADLTGFADRNFYDDWWNSKTLGEYWRKWNLPVHNWLTRHIYFPLIRRGWSKVVSMLVVFFFSALMHEYLLAGCIGAVTMIGFNTMASQLPFIIIQESFKKQLGGQAGNILFWAFFCVVGQPAGMVMGSILLS